MNIQEDVNISSNTLCLPAEQEGQGGDVPESAQNVEGGDDDLAGDAKVACGCLQDVILTLAGVLQESRGRERVGSEVLQSQREHCFVYIHCSP